MYALNFLTKDTITFYIWLLIFGSPSFSSFIGIFNSVKAPVIFDNSLLI